MMVHIVTNTGNDGEASRGSKGYVFVMDPVTRQEAYIFYSQAELIDEDVWVGLWRKQVYNVVDGTVIKLAGGWTFYGKPHDYAMAYFIVREGSPIVKVSCRARGAQKGCIIGPLEQVPYKEIELKLGIKLHPQYKKYYKGNGIIIETTEEAVHLD